MFKLVLEKAEEPEIKLPTTAGSLKKQESSRKNIYFCFIDYAKALTVWITMNCGSSLSPTLSPRPLAIATWRDSRLSQGLSSLPRRNLPIRGPRLSHPKEMGPSKQPWFPVTLGHLVAPPLTPREPCCWFQHCLRRVGLDS